MPKPHATISLESFTTFGELLRYLRERAHLSQRELAAQVGYHYSYISYLEKNIRAADEAVLLGRFVPALGLEDEPQLVGRLLELASDRRKRGPITVPVPPVEPAQPEQNLSQLPPTLTPMLGREHEAALLEEMLCRSGVRLITVVGPPGVGKTRLALHIAERAQRTFGDGVFFVNLTPVSHPELVVPAIAAAMDVHEPTARNLKSALHQKSILLVMDNFEQVVEAAPQLIPLLGEAPGLKILSTSREALRVRGEHEFPLAPLPVPDHAFLDSPAVQLFVERARAVKPDFHLNDETAACVAEICRHLDGLPLAIELAAARVRSLSPSAMLEQFDRRFDWLTHGGRDMFLWQRTLWGAINWSYALLSGQERALLNRLSVFAGGWTLEAAEAVCCDEILCARSDILSLLMQLVDKSLVVAENDGARYGFLETLREFAYGKLKESTELEHIRQLHCECFLKFAQTAQPFLEKGNEQARWLDLVEAEHSNLRLALAWATESLSRAPLALALARALHPFWLTHSYISEARLWLDKVLAMDPAPTLLRAELLRFNADYARTQGDYARALELEQQGLEISQRLEDDRGIYASMDGMATLAGMQGDYARCAELLEEVLVYRRQTNDLMRLTPTLNNLAIATRRLGNVQRAKELLEEAIAAGRAIGNHRSLSYSLSGLAEVHADLKEYATTIQLQRESLAIRHKLGSLKDVVFSLDSLAMAQNHLGNTLLAVVLKSASEKLRAQLGVGLVPTARAEQASFLADLRLKLGDSAFEEAWSRGQTMHIDQVLALAMQDPL